MDPFLIVSQLIILVSFLYFVFNHDKQEREKALKQNEDFNRLSGEVIQSLAGNNTEFIKQLTLLQKEFSKDLSAQSTKSLASVEKLSTKVLELSTKPKEIIREVVKEEPKKIDAYNLVNDIEKEDLPEQELSDIPRIPMVNGVKLQFEDEEASYPIDITPVGNVSPNLFSDFGAES